MKRICLIFLLLSAGFCGREVFASASDYPIRPVAFTQVSLEDSFWSPRQKTNAEVTLWSNFRKCEQTGRIANFEKAAGLRQGKHLGERYNDSDVYKAIEAAAYSLQVYPDGVLERYVDSLIDVIAAAQQDDGYLNTFVTLPSEPSRSLAWLERQVGDPKKRWASLKYVHELYCAGHFIEAAVAYYQATGKRKALDVAIKLADHIDSVFGPEKKRGTPGHQEIEIALVKLYRVTGEERYLELAKYFLSQRGRFEDRQPSYGINCQDHKPVTEQFEAVGHAVRANYMYAAMADVAALTGEERYLKAIGRIWEDMALSKLYITGGVGAEPDGEAYGDAYTLPNSKAYNETCAAIANIFWNHRMFLLYGDAKYIDVLERTLYNGFLSGISLDGDKFFYPNPLEADGKTPFNRGNLTRCPWFDCSCCPPNIARLMASLSGYVYAVNDDTVFVNLFIAGRGKADIGGSEIRLTQQTGYPWDGAIKIIVDTEHEKEFALAVRIPGWARNKPVPSDLYRYLKSREEKFCIKLNGQEIHAEVGQRGYAVLKRLWKKSDTVELVLPMRVRRVLADERVEADRGRVALERGPIVFCAEAADNGGNIRNLLLEDESALNYHWNQDLLDGIGTIRGKAKVLVGNTDKVETIEQKFTAVPYYWWSNRGVGAMQVWLARTHKTAHKATAER